jgi:hypothetical protein
LGAKTPIPAELKESLYTESTEQRIYSLNLTQASKAKKNAVGRIINSLCFLIVISPLTTGFGHGNSSPSAQPSDPLFCPSPSARVFCNAILKKYQLTNPCSASSGIDRSSRRLPHRNPHPAIPLDCSDFSAPGLSDREIPGTGFIRFDAPLRNVSGE